METYLNVEEMAAYLGITVQTIRRWIAKREIPFHKIMSVIRFRVSEVEKWIDEGGLERQTEIQNGVEGGLFEDVISLDELAEMEQANEEPEDEDD